MPTPLWTIRPDDLATGKNLAFYGGATEDGPFVRLGTAIKSGDGYTCDGELNKHRYITLTSEED